jgi:signal transduction histidine kinase
MKNRLRANIYAGFFISSLLIATISFFYYKSTDDFVQAAEDVQRSTLRLRQLERVLSLLKDAETGERGYIITRQEPFLAPYRSAITRLNSQMQLLEQLTAQIPFYQQRMPLLDSLISRHIAALNSNISLVQQGQMQQVTESVLSGKAKKLLDSIRFTIGYMQQYEENLLVDLQEVAEKDVQTNYLVNAIGIALTVSLFAIGFWLTTSELTLREQLEKELLEKNEELLSLNEELKAALEEARASNEKIREYSAILEEKNQALEFLNKELEAFSYTVSHDLQTPLHTISGFVGLLSQAPAVVHDREVTRQLSIIEKSAARMNSLINDLLRFSRVGKLSLQKTISLMNHLLQLAIHELSESLNLQRVNIIVNPLPPVYADRKLLYQVWINLLSNAVKFSAKVPEPIVEIACKESAGRYVFSVSDNGVGFDKNLGDPFWVFKRLHRKEEYEGTGIGLAIVQRIVERHGGEVWADSTPGNGATFYFSLPKEKPPA